MKNFEDFIYWKLVENAYGDEVKSKDFIKIAKEINEFIQNANEN